MNAEQEFFDLLDQYDAGQLNEADRGKLESKLASDPLFRNKAKEHREIIASMKAYVRHNEWKKALTKVHEEEIQESYPVAPVQPKERFLKRYWPMIGVAATVAFISIAGTWFTLNSMEEKQKAIYKDMRRNVDQTNRSINSLKADIAAAKLKDDKYAGKYSGTGFLISPAGYIATSYHVIKGADSVYVQNESFGRFKADILFSDPANDVAILRVSDPTFKVAHPVPFRISSEEANLGESVFTLGFPREDIVYGEGSVSAATGYRQNENAYQVSVPVNPGNSGGPLMNQQGDVIGIISGIQTETSGAAFAIKSRVLLEVIQEVPDSLKTSFRLPAASYLRNTNKVQQVKRWKEFVFMVKVYNK